MGTRYLANFDLAKLPHVFCDVLVVGTGIAGLYTALKVREVGRVVVLTKRKLEESNTEYAQGGIAAAMGDQDSPRLHLLDTLEAGQVSVRKRPSRCWSRRGPTACGNSSALGRSSTRTRRGS